MNKLILEKVRCLPRDLTPGILYVSDEYSVAGHLCACGCGNKVITPLGPAEWAFSTQDGLPTLRPSVGNWQLPCRSHYLVIAGCVIWSGQLSDRSILAGRRAEEQHRTAYYSSLDAQRTVWVRVKHWLIQIFSCLRRK